MAAFVVVVAGMRAAQPLVVPFLLATFLAIICTPPLEYLRRRRVPAPVALAIVLSSASLVFLTVVVVALASITDFIANKDSLQSEFGQVRAQILEKIDRREEDADGAEEDGDAVGDAHLSSAGDEQEGPSLSPADAPPESVDPGGLEGMTEDLKEFLSAVLVPGRIVGFFVGLAASLGGLLTNAFLVLVTLAMILLEASGFPAKMLALFRGEPTGLRQAEKIREAVIHYVSIKSWVSLVVGVGIAAWTQFLGVPYAVLWGILGFFFNFVPNIGSFIAAVPTVLIALLHGEPPNWSLALWTSGGYVVINCVVGYMIEPRLMGRELGLSTLVVFISLVFWGWVLGPVGMLLSVPLTMIAKIVLDAAPETRWVGVLLSGDPRAVVDSNAGPAVAQLP